MIKVIDSMMGSGKTTWAMNYMNSNLDKRFIYITPYLHEAQRIVTLCPHLCIRQPEELPTKQAHFIRLLKDGANVAISHELFMRLE